MAPGKLRDNDPPELSQDGASAWKRRIIYLVVALGLAVAIWALMRGADRDLVNQPSALLGQRARAWAL